MASLVRFWPLLLLVAAVWFGWDSATKSADLRAVRADLRAAQEALEMAEHINALHVDYLARAAQERRALLDVHLQLQSMEDGDVPLSGYLSSAASLLWGQE